MGMGELHTGDYYKVLGLTPLASDTSIKARYRSLCKTYHPDMGGTHADMARLNEAYATLSDPAKRARYDQQLQRSRQAQQSVQPRPTPPPQPPQAAYAAPRSYTQARQPARKHSFGWFKLAGALAALLILVGAITHLPIVEVFGVSDNSANTPASKPLNVTYQPDTTPTSSAPSSSSTPQVTQVISVPAQATPPTPDSTPAQTPTPSKKTNDQKNRFCDYLNRHRICTLDDSVAQACKDYCNNAPAQY